MWKREKLKTESPFSLQVEKEETESTLFTFGAQRRRRGRRHRRDSRARISELQINMLSECACSSILEANEC